MSTIQWICLVVCGMIAGFSYIKADEYSTILRRDDMTPTRSLTGDVRNEILNKGWFWAIICLLAFLPFVYGGLSLIINVVYYMLQNYSHEPGTVFLMSFGTFAGSLIALWFVSKHFSEEFALIGLVLSLIGLAHSVLMFLTGIAIWLNMSFVSMFVAR